MVTLSNQVIVRVTCWDLKSHLFKVWWIQLPQGTKIWGGDLKTSLRKVFEKGTKIHVISHIKGCSSTTYHILLAKLGELPMELYSLTLIVGWFQLRLVQLSSSWLVNQATSLDTLTNKDLTLDTSWQPCGRHHVLYLNGKPMTTQHHQNSHSTILELIPSLTEETRLPPPQGFSWIWTWIVHEATIDTTPTHLKS